MTKQPNAPVRETRELQLHKNILKDIVFAQAGTREKAILEGVMNSVDAEGSKIDITLTAKSLRIVDDGRGFLSREEIVANFETFGTPHQEGDAKYGRFRMGRGQLFAKGRNRWRTHTFQMDVDAKTALEYHLQEHLPKVRGCQIDVEWYDVLLPSEQQAIIRALTQMVLYVDTPVSINGKVVSKNPAEQKWDQETPDAYFKFTVGGSLSIYNLGVLVEDLSNHVHGTGGVVVAKKKLKVNFARNQVMSDCPVWRRALKVVQTHAGKEVEEKVSKKQELSDGQREHLCQELMAGTLAMEMALTAKLFTDVTGTHVSVNNIHSWMERYSTDNISVCAPDDARGDKLMQQGQCFVLSAASLERFDVASLKEFRALFNVGEYNHAKGRDIGQGRLGAYYHVWYKIRRWKPQDFTVMAKGISTDHVIVPEKDWTPTERLVMETIRRCQGELLTWKEREEKLRTVVLGESQTAIGWTDGTSYIALQRKLLPSLDMDVRNWSRVAQVLLHEYCHRDASVNGHVHNDGFYKRFHDRAENTIGAFVHRAVFEHVKVLESANKVLRKEVNRFLDRDVKKRTALEEYERNQAKKAVVLAAREEGK